MTNQNPSTSSDNDDSSEVSMALNAIKVELRIHPENRDRTVAEWITWLEDSSFDITKLWTSIKSEISHQSDSSCHDQMQITEQLSDLKDLSLASLLEHAKVANHESVYDLISSFFSSEDTLEELLNSSGGGNCVKWIDHHPAYDSALVMGVGLTLAAIRYLHKRRQANRAQVPEAAQRATDEVDAQVPEVAQRASHEVDAQAPELAQRDNKLNIDDRFANLIDKAHASGGETLKNIDFTNKQSAITPVDRKNAICQEKDKFIQDISNPAGRANKQNEVLNFTKARQRYLGQNDDNIINLKTNNEGKIHLPDEIFYKPYNPADLSFSPSTSKLDKLLQNISYKDIKLVPIVRIKDEKNVLQDKMMIKYDNSRYFVRIEYDNHEMLMYKSSGSAGKPWPKGKWYLFNGIGREGWINKDDNSLLNLGDSDITKIGDQVDKKFFNDNRNYDRTGKKLRSSQFFQKASDDDGIKAAYMKAINKGCNPTENIYEPAYKPDDKNLYHFDTNAKYYDQDGNEASIFEKGSKSSLKKYITIQYPNQPELTEPNNLPAAIKQCGHKFTSYAVDDADIIRQLNLNDYSLDNAGNYFDHISKYFNSDSRHLRDGAIKPSKIQEERGKFRTTYLQNEGFEFQKPESFWQQFKALFSKKYAEIRPDSDLELYKDFKWRLVIEKDPASVVRDFCDQCKFNIQVQDRFQNSAFKEKSDDQMRWKTREPDKSEYIDSKYWIVNGNSLSSNFERYRRLLGRPLPPDAQRKDVQEMREKIISKLRVLNESRFSDLRSQVSDAIEFLEHNNKDGKRSDKINRLRDLRLALESNDGESSITDDDRLGFLQGASPDAQEFLRGVKYDGMDTDDNQFKINYIRREIETDPDLKARLDAHVEVHARHNKALNLGEVTIQNKDLKLNESTLNRLDRFVLTHQEAADNVANHSKPLIDDQQPEDGAQPRSGATRGDQLLIDDDSSLVAHDMLLRPEHQLDHMVTDTDHKVSQDASEFLNQADTEIKAADDSLADKKDSLGDACE